MEEFKLLNELLKQSKKNNVAKFVEKLSITLEHEKYKNIPGTNSSVRQDKGNTNTKTQDHAHVYAKRNGGGKELYSVNLDGSGHDGSSGKSIPSSHADFLRSLGYEIPVNLVLESIEPTSINLDDFQFCILFEDVQ